jgi:hypothetical protein
MLALVAMRTPNLRVKLITFVSVEPAHIPDSLAAIPAIKDTQAKPLMEAMKIWRRRQIGLNAFSHRW